MREGLSVFTEYVSIESLPSYQIHTPDPRLFAPDVGEKLHISWQVPNSCSSDSLKLKLSLQFGDRTTQIVWIDLYVNSGTYVYSLLNEEYWTLQGVFTYQVELFQNDLLIYIWQHQMWAERIELTNSKLSINP